MEHKTFQGTPLIERTIFYRNSFDGGDGWSSHASRILISSRCPKCHMPRGDAYNHTFCEDGEWFTVQRWDNPCGHIDSYRNCWHEAAKIQRTIIESALAKQQNTGNSIDQIGHELARNLNQDADIVIDLFNFSKTPGEFIEETRYYDWEIAGIDHAHIASAFSKRKQCELKAVAR